MLSSISWQQFLAVLSILTLAYYAYVGLRYYQREIRNFFVKRTATVPQSAASSPPFQVMGTARPDHGVSISDSEELHFVVDDEPESEITETPRPKTPDTPPSDPTDALVKDVSHLVNAFQEIDDKPEFLSLLHIQIGTYQADAEEIDWPRVKKRVMQLTHEKLPFAIQETDLQLNA